MENISALKICSVCSRNERKYRCPKCSAFSCSLSCAKKHKKIENCDGIRPPAQYLPLDKFSELETLNDYRFLENVASRLDNSRRVVVMDVNQTSENRSLLLRECRSRNISLRLPPFYFTVGKSKMPIFNSQENQLYWCIKWVFVHSNCCIYDENVPENMTLGAALEPHLLGDRSNVFFPQLQYYISASFRGIVPLVTLPRALSQTKIHEELDFSETILSNISGKSVQEHLIIYLVLKEHRHLYLTD